MPESDPKPFYIGRNMDGSRDEYVLQDDGDGGAEVLHRRVTPSGHGSGVDLVRHMQAWDADEFDGQNVPPRARLALQKLREALRRMQEVRNTRRT